MQITGKNLLTLKSSLERALDDCLTELGHLDSRSQVEVLEIAHKVEWEMKKISYLLDRCNKELEKDSGS